MRVRVDEKSERFVAWCRCVCRLAVVGVVVAAALVGWERSLLAASDLWIVDTRPATTAVPDADHYHRISFEQWDETRRQFIRSSRDAFVDSSDPTVPLLFLIHGNWMKRSEAVAYGRDFARRVPNERCRVVIWTWPSERVDARPRVDIQIKAGRADRQASYIVWFLRELKPNSLVTVAGFSFGARLASMALEEMATIYGTETGIRLRAILMAAAFDSTWLLPGRRLEHALHLAERCDILYNPRDDKLRFYPFIDSLCGQGPTALGATGLNVHRLAEADQSRTRSINVVRLIGADHSFVSSLRSLLHYGHFHEVALFGER